MTKIYAHRGANREAAENTRTAFNLAINQAVDGIETDIQLSKDGVAVLWHDDDLAKINYPNLRIENFTWEQLKQLNFAAYFPDAQTERIVGLEEFVETYQARCALLLEIKKYAGENLARQHQKIERTLASVIHKNADILISSFDLDSLIYAHQIAPQAPLILNLEAHHSADLAAQLLDSHIWLTGICVHVSTLDQVMVNTARDRAKLLATYTGNSDAEIRLAINLGVDILISDLPKTALQIKLSRQINPSN